MKKVHEGAFCEIIYYLWQASKLSWLSKQSSGSKSESTITSEGRETWDELQLLSSAFHSSSSHDGSDCLSNTNTHTHTHTHTHTEKHLPLTLAAALSCCSIDICIDLCVVVSVSFFVQSHCLTHTLESHLRNADVTAEQTLTIWACRWHVGLAQGTKVRSAWYSKEQQMQHFKCPKTSGSNADNTAVYPL